MDILAKSIHRNNENKERLALTVSLKQIYRSPELEREKKEIERQRMSGVTRPGKTGGSGRVSYPGQNGSGSRWVVIKTGQNGSGQDGSGSERIMKKMKMITGYRD
ncbi:hypothetical protein QVD17_09978 [Tagetes erecta]|uniref:Uncharacterized protein n=1 Tax=Tagetes erecta TaxID=13708 RepID=A0AAD8L1J6_TARER|nr:hypothetical protein QVD17_09978 [Tagetes erecta]